MVRKQKSKSRNVNTQQEQQEQQELKSYDYTKVKRFTPKWFMQRWNLKRNPEKMVLVNMEFENGFFDSWLVKAKDNGFRYKNNKYLFDDQFKYYHISSEHWVYDYHENFALPIKRKFPVNEIKATIENTQEIEFEYAVNPSSLNRFITAKIAEGIMQGQDIPELIRRMFMLLIIIIIVVVINILLFMYKTGMFAQIKGSVGL
jgi:hypothetical protein